MREFEEKGPGVEARLDRLELSNRRLRLFAVLLAITTVILTGETLHLVSGRLKRVEAEDFVVKSKSGKMRAHLGVRADGLPEFGLYDEKGELKAALHMYSDLGTALVFNNAGGTRFYVDSSGDGSASLQLFDRTGRSSTSLLVREDGTTSFSLDHDRSSILMGVKPGFPPSLVVTDAQGHEQGRLGSPGVNALNQTLRPVLPGNVFRQPVTESARL